MRDIDLAGFGEESKIFKINSDNVRKEYSHISDEVYVPARIDILNTFLKRERIYLTDFFYNRYEKRARENIINEIKSLKGE